MPIPLISNFSVNVQEPIDTRLVSADSTVMNNMLYKYEGLTTYRLDEDLNYTFINNAWRISSNGIYGGSGQLRGPLTLVNFGTVSNDPGFISNILGFRSPISSSSEIRIQNSFRRHPNGTGVRYESQMRLIDGATTVGPFIYYNPAVENNNSTGGISFGTGFLTPLERLRIEGNGMIRFKPNASLGLKSVNIGTDFTGTRPFLGYNWNGSTAESNSSDQAGYIQFNDSQISINTYNGLSVTHSAIFTRDLITLNGGLVVTGGTISTTRNIQFGAADSGVYSLLSASRFGIRYDGGTNRNYAELVSAPTPTSAPQASLRWGPVTSGGTLVTVLSPILFTASTSNYALFQSTIISEGKSRMWDNVFNPDYGAGLGTNALFRIPDLIFSLESGESTKNLSIDDANGNAIGAENNNIHVSNSFSTSGPRTTSEFTIFIGAGYTCSTTQENTVAKSTFVNSPKDYDRIFYFYLDGQRRQIQHQVRWWLGEPKPGSNDLRYVQIGNIETGNRNGIGIESTSYGNTSNYRSRFYSQTVFVPANMAFKIQFRFHVAQNFTTGSTVVNSPVVFMNVIRSGKFRTVAYQTPTEQLTPLTNPNGNVSGLGYPGSVAEGSIIVAPGPPGGS